MGARTKISLFFLFPTGNFILSSLSGRYSRGILVVFFEDRGAQMCATGFLWMSCEAPAAGPPKFNEKTPRERKEKKISDGGEKKKSEILGGPREGRSGGVREAKKS